MPQKRNNPEPPMMTWKKASWVLVLAALFDVLRYMCFFLWFFGPALAALYCTAKVGDTAIIGGLLAAGCVAVAAAAGFAGFTIAAALGSVLAIAVGFFGWLTITVIIAATNQRAFAKNPSLALWSFAGIGASVFLMAWGIYRTQIAHEKAEHKKWGKENAGREQEAQQVRASRVAALMQEAQGMQQEAANDAQYEQREAA